MQVQMNDISNQEYCLARDIYLSLSTLDNWMSISFTSYQKRDKLKGCICFRTTLYEFYGEFQTYCMIIEELKCILKNFFSSLRGCNGRDNSYDSKRILTIF